MLSDFVHHLFSRMQEVRIYAIFVHLMNYHGEVVHNYYNGSAEGHEYPDLQVGDEVNPRLFFSVI